MVGVPELHISYDQDINLAGNSDVARQFPSINMHTSVSKEVRFQGCDPRQRTEIDLSTMSSLLTIRLKDLSQTSKKC